MRRLVETLLDQDAGFIQLNTNRALNVDEIVDKLARAIIGQNIDDQLPLLHEIISGPFDADKLDYFVRDSHCAGTPSLLDISRLIQKIAIREMDAAELPKGVAGQVKHRPKYILFGIKWSGISVLDELHLSRVLLYAKIYRHPKVAAVEQMLRAAIMTIASVVDPKKVLNLLYHHNDDELLGVSVKSLAALLDLDVDCLDEGQKERLSTATAILTKIRLRNLSVKAFQLQRNYPADPLAQDETQKHGLVAFREIIEQRDDREAFRAELLGEIEHIIDTLNVPRRSRVELEGSIMIHPIGQTPGGTQIGRAYLLPPSGSPIEFREYLVNRTAWADGYLSDQPAGYVFSDSAIADYAYIAIERLLRIKFEVRLPTSAFDASKRFEGAIQDLKRRLNNAGYYRGSPFDIRPTPDRLNMADVVRTIADFTPKLERYQKPALPAEPQVMTPPTVLCREWLRQLDDDAHVECGLQLLAGFRMIDRQDTVRALRTFIETHDDFRGGVVVPFGSARDSSAIQTYFSGDLQGSHISACMALSEATRQSNGKPIIFVDDFIGSGGQSRDVLAAGFGRDELRADLGENRDLFDGDIQQFLKQAKVAFVFTAAWDSGITEINATAAKLGLNACVYRLLGEDEIPFATSNFFDSLPEHQVQAFLTRCSEIGRSLIESRATPRRDETKEQRQQKVASRALGYGNRAMLLASPFNVPTQTMTMFWADGIVDGATWRPLMPRRKKV